MLAWRESELYKGSNQNLYARIYEPSGNFYSLHKRIFSFQSISWMTYIISSTIILECLIDNESHSMFRFFRDIILLIVVREKEKRNYILCSKWKNKLLSNRNNLPLVCRAERFDEKQLDNFVISSCDNKSFLLKLFFNFFNLSI